ncbi:NUDIX domain-containing protein [Alicyclobacillus fastidiosus]|uniref:NUDIX domain-containing protein n=1 Tax=Alicyclobacillus fastidiosus TaxID=392011 RepID=A0ABV5AHQ7_9BACL|nr:NUDIX domain-containing protein [Alicyclobacillus fastidiosus]WEH11559.1 NUDIX domain-containing protein [Alicyclobacillus fastidiosus]
MRVYSDDGTLERPIRPAATLIVLRDYLGGMEVLLVRRSNSMRTFPGHLAFPGGGVEAADQACIGVCTMGRPRAAIRLDDDVFAVAALRETVEEIGWLGAPVWPEGLSVDAAVDQEIQSALLDGSQTFAEALGRRNLQLNLGDVRFVGRWLTPPEVKLPVRFDTRFFVTRGTGEYRSFCVHHGELDWAGWRSPGDVLEDIRAGLEQAALPTQTMLEALAEAPSVDWCLEYLDVPQIPLT